MVSKSEGELGQYDLYILFAEHYKWAQTDVDAADPGLVDELLEFIEAKAKVREEEEKEREIKEKRENRRHARRARRGRY